MQQKAAAAIFLDGCRGRQESNWREATLNTLDASAPVKIAKTKG